jgi:hypothetical protein
VRRLFAFRQEVAGHLRSARIEWLYRGGASIAFAEENVHRAASHRVIVVMLGGNDIDNGMSPLQLADRAGLLAHELLRQGSDVDAVVITSLWPRQDRHFNARAREYAGIMERRFFGDPQITFWLWDRRQPWRTVDGVHLLRHGYQVAVTYLVAAVVWAIHHNQW